MHFEATPSQLPGCELHTPLCIITYPTKPEQSKPVLGDLPPLLYLIPRFGFAFDIIVLLIELSAAAAFWTAVAVSSCFPYFIVLSGAGRDFI